jgi:hypothetical protein
MYFSRTRARRLRKENKLLKEIIKTIHVEVCETGDLIPGPSYWVTSTGSVTQKQIALINKITKDKR